MPNSSTTGLTEQMVRESTIHANLAQELIVTTRDKLELCLVHHQRSLESQQLWAIPFGIFVPVVLTLVTADFRNALGLKQDTWQAIFLIVAVLTFGFTVHFGLRASRIWWSGRVESIDGIIADLKASRAPGQSRL